MSINVNSLISWQCRVLIQISSHLFLLSVLTSLVSCTEHPIKNGKEEIKKVLIDWLVMSVFSIIVNSSQVFGHMTKLCLTGYGPRALMLCRHGVSSKKVWLHVCKFGVPAPWLKGWVHVLCSMVTKRIMNFKCWCYLTVQHKKYHFFYFLLLFGNIWCLWDCLTGNDAIKSDTHTHTQLGCSLLRCLVSFLGVTDGQRGRRRWLGK